MELLMEREKADKAAKQVRAAQAAATQASASAGTGSGGWVSGPPSPLASRHTLPRALIPGNQDHVRWV